MRPRLLDLFSCAGGASAGYAAAGFEVVGVDVQPQPRYPYEFHQADALTFPLDGFDVVAASPPCRDHTALANVVGRTGSAWMLDAVVERLRAWAAAGPNRVWVVENVEGSGLSLSSSAKFCGSAWGLPVRRHRYFLSNALLLSPGCMHGAGQSLPMFGHFTGAKSIGQALGLGWMRRGELAQAIPPAYTECIGGQLGVVERKAGAGA